MPDRRRVRGRASAPKGKTVSTEPTMTGAGVAAALLAPPADAAPPAPTVASVDLSAALAGLVSAADAGRALVETLPCGLALLDDTAGGLVRGESCGLAAAPGTGKSTLADRLALNALRKTPGTRALIVNLETATPIRAARLLAGDSVLLGTAGEITRCIPLGALERGTLREPGQALVREHAARLAAEVGGRLTFVDSVYDPRRLADLIRERRPDVLVLDHCGLLASDIASAVEAMDFALHEIAGALREANAAGILIAELSKAALAGGSSDVGAVRGSARFASLAGQLLTIRRSDDDALDTSDRAPQSLRLELRKNRHGRGMLAQDAQLFGGLAHWHFDPCVTPLERTAPNKGRACGD